MRISDWSSDVCSSDLAQHQRLFVVFLAVGPEVRQGAQHEVIGLQVLRRVPPGALDLGGADSGVDGAGDARGNAVLQLEEAAAGVLEAIGPKLAPGLGVDQLHGRSEERRVRKECVSKGKLRG